MANNELLLMLFLTFTLLIVTFLVLWFYSKPKTSSAK